jgi:hypothetical protein
MDKRKLLLHKTILSNTSNGFWGRSSLIIREYLLSALSQGGVDDNILKYYHLYNQEIDVL